MAWNLHAIEQTQSRERRRVDGMRTRGKTALRELLEFDLPVRIHVEGLELLQ